MLVESRGWRTKKEKKKKGQIINKCNFRSKHSLEKFLQIKGIIKKIKINYKLKEKQSKTKTFGQILTSDQKKKKMAAETEKKTEIKD